MIQNKLITLLKIWWYLNYHTTVRVPVFLFLYSGIFSTLFMEKCME